MRRFLPLAFLLLVLPLLGFAKARIEVPRELDDAEAHAVTGHNPRTWNRPIAFGPWRTVAVREGATRSWSLEAFGLGAGASKRPYELVLEGPDGARREVACLTRGLELWRGSLGVDLQRIAAPRLACVIRGDEGSPHATLVLGQKGVKLEGELWLGGSSAGRPSLDVASIHRLAGSRLPSSEPMGYSVGRNGAAILAVETVNRGRVWLASTSDDGTGADLAAAAAALLLFEPEISPR